MCNGMTPEKKEEIRKEIKDILVKALDKLYHIDKKNIRDGVSERNLCARLAMYIEQKMRRSSIRGYYVDVEYNRQRKQDDKSKTEPKTESKTESKTELKNMVCDLLIHSRGGKKTENLLALEMKKENMRNAETDKERLKRMTLPDEDDSSGTKNTILGAFVKITKKRSSITYYEEGEEKEKEEKVRNVEEKKKKKKKRKEEKKKSKGCSTDYKTIMRR